MACQGASHIEVLLAELDLCCALRQGMLGLLQGALHILDVAQPLPEVCLLLRHLRGRLAGRLRLLRPISSPKFWMPTSAMHPGIRRSE